MIVRKITLAFLLFFCIILNAQVSSVSLQADKDTYLYQFSGTPNGSSQLLYTYPWAPGFSRRGLISFNLSAISGTIVSAYLVLSEVTSYGISRTLNFHRVTNTWIESSANWTTPWALPGGDYNAAISGTLAAIFPGINKDSVDVTADVQGFLSATYTNYGWLFMDSNEDNSQNWWAFGSKENVNINDRPILRINYIATAVLPISLTDFSLTCSEGMVDVYWKTLSEKNNDYYLLEKSSDARSWEPITQIKVPQNSDKPKSYSYRDSGVSKQIYYRLKQIDLDGSFSYSKIIGTNASCHRNNEDIHVYFNDKFDKLFFVTSTIIDHVQVVDYTGRSITLGVQDSSIDISMLAKGFYYLRFTSIDGNLFIKKIIKY